jgi:hypothetical protein
MGTCDGGTESLLNCLHVLDLRSYPICRIHTVSIAAGIHLWIHVTLAIEVLIASTCVSAAPSGGRSLVVFSACVACQEEI